MNICNLQKEVHIWSLSNFGPENANQKFLGIVEEVGELAHCLLKKEQSIRGGYTEEGKLELTERTKDCLADIIIFAAGFCNSQGWDLENIVERVWRDVQKRDWRKFPLDGLTR